MCGCIPLSWKYINKLYRKEGLEFYRREDNTEATELYVPNKQIPLKSVELRSKRKMRYPLGFWILKISLLGKEKYRDSEKPRFIKYGQSFPRVLHTLLRSGACGLEGLTGTESPAADGMYITGPVCVGLDTVEDCCKSSLSAGSGRNESTWNVTQSCTFAMELTMFKNKNTQTFLKEEIFHKHLLTSIEARRNPI